MRGSANKPYIGRGISGQTTTQMLVRFRQDVVALTPRVVVILEYAATHNAVFVDFHTPLSDERQGFKRNLSGDGVHPNLAGYRAMAPLVERGIAEAMRR